MPWIPKIEWKKGEKGSFGREKSGKTPGFDWNSHGKKKEGIKGINQGMIGGKKTKGKKKANESHPAKNFGSQIPRKQHFLFHLQWTRPEKRESPHSRMDFGGKRGIFLYFIPTGMGEFSQNSHSEGILGGKRHGGDPGIFLGIFGECRAIPEGWN